jgi:hypothetical protein
MKSRARDRRRRRQPEDVVAATGGEDHHLVDQVGRQTQFLQGRLQVHRDGVEVVLVESPLDQRRVGLAHLLAGIFLRASHGPAEEILLLRPLLVHVDVVKEITDRVVLQDLAVENVDGRFAANALVDWGGHDDYPPYVGCFVHCAASRRCRQSLHWIESMRHRSIVDRRTKSRR